MNSILINKKPHWKVYLSDVADAPYLITRGTVLRARGNLCDEDWKTSLAKNKPSIPFGSTVTVNDVYQNRYGVYIQVSYLGTLYSLQPKDLEYVKL